MVIRLLLNHVRRDRPVCGAVVGAGCAFLAAGAAVISSTTDRRSATTTTRMEEDEQQAQVIPDAESSSFDDSASKKEDEPLFYDQCLERQVYKPLLPYPAWDANWDFRQQYTDEAPKNATGKTRHILLIRHGQYHQSSPHDEDRVLTPLGRRQAAYTGQRLGKMLAANALHMRYHAHGNETDEFAGPCRIKAIHASNMARAQETASIILSHIQQSQDTAYHRQDHRSAHTITMTEPDPLLNEGLPSPIIPMRPDVGSIEFQAKEIDENHYRIEAAFQKYIHRADLTSIKLDDDDNDDDNDDNVHEFEVIVGHANVLRYFFFRALQLPPEAWLRLSLFNCSITYLMVQPNGYVTVRLVGDTGHIPYEETTFSGAYGYNWKSPTST